MRLDLPDVARHLPPPLDLPGIFCRYAPAHVVATVPLKPPPRVLVVYPALALPLAQGLTGIDFEKVEAGISPLPLRSKTGVLKPIRWELISTIAHVHTTKYTELQHFFGRQLWLEVRRKIFAHRRHELVLVPSLHLVVYEYSSVHHPKISLTYFVLLTYPT